MPNFFSLHLLTYEVPKKCVLSDLSINFPFFHTSNQTIEWLFLVPFVFFYVDKNDKWSLIKIYIMFWLWWLADFMAFVK